MCSVKIILDDGEYYMSIEKALLIPTIRDSIRKRENREYYLQKILRSNYSPARKASLLNQLK